MDEGSAAETAKVWGGKRRIGAGHFRGMGDAGSVSRGATLNQRVRELKSLNAAGIFRWGPCISGVWVAGGLVWGAQFFLKKIHFDLV